MNVAIQVIAAMTNGGVDRAVECTGSIQAMISAFECVHDVLNHNPLALFDAKKFTLRFLRLNLDLFFSGLGCCCTCWSAKQR